MLSSVLHYEQLNLTKLEKMVQGFKLARPCMENRDRSRGWWFWGGSNLGGAKKNCQEQLLEDVSSFKYAMLFSASP